MRAIMVMFDSLNRHMLPPYNPQTWVHAPNFRRLAERSVTFDRSYVCSMPCMPARRDLHTGRPNFLHNNWGPLEPFDDSVPRMLRENGCSSHLITDHYHYFEDGGATYHTQYSTWRFFRGQEGDPWMGQANPPDPPDHCNGKSRDQDWINRQFMRHEQDQPGPKTFDAAAEFIHRNHDDDRWFLQIENFDPHEPFFSSRTYKDLYAQHDDRYEGKLFDSPGYHAVTESPEEIEHVRHEYAALMSACDKRLGDVMDLMDRYAMWEDTMLIVWTDHGFLLGEHDCWAKNWMPLFEEVSHTPFFVWDPRTGQAGERREALVQPSIDLGPTLLGFFGLEPTADMTGRDLVPALESDAPVRDAAIFGYHNMRVNVTDGRYVYMRGEEADGVARYTYTLMPTRMRGFAQNPSEETAGPFQFTKGRKLLRYEAGESQAGASEDPIFHARAGTLLYDLEADPKQERSIEDEAVSRRLAQAMSVEMQRCDAPSWQYQRLGLETPSDPAPSV